MKSRNLFIIYFSYNLLLLPQSYQVIKYNIETKMIDTLPIIEFDSLNTSDFTKWNYGLDSNKELLNLNPPKNTYNNSGFTDYLPAQRLFDVNKYPIRTAIKIFRLINDSLKQKCSGILVAKDYILTACHCIGSYDSLGNFIFEDSLFAFPAFDNGSENKNAGYSKAIEYVTFTENVKGFVSPTIDIALVKLKDSLGIKNGWVGIAYNEDDLFFRNNIFQKLSYPSSVDLVDSTRIYNGDTLYYNYGKLDLIDKTWLGYNIFAIKGQSGSSLLYSDNTKFYSMGPLIWSGNSRHLRINKDIFYSFKSVLNNTPTGLNNQTESYDKFQLSNAYPNPFNPTTTIQYSISQNCKVKITVYNLLGEVVTKLVNDYKIKGSYITQFDGLNFTSGVYIYVMEAGNYYSTQKMILIK